MGGRDFDAPSLVDDAVLDAIERLSPLAPLHNPANLATIRVALELLAEVPHVAVFDTAFFSDLPPAAATYALDHEVADAHGIRPYGFHGTQHQYVAQATADLPAPEIRRAPRTEEVSPYVWYPVVPVTFNKKKTKTH